MSDFWEDVTCEKFNKIVNGYTTFYLTNKLWIPKSIKNIIYSYIYLEYEYIFFEKGKKLSSNIISQDKNITIKKIFPPIIDIISHYLFFIDNNNKLHYKHLTNSKSIITKEIGLNTENYFKNLPIKLIANAKKSNHLFILTKDNQLFSVGANDYFQSAINNNNQIILKPTKIINIPFKTEIISIQISLEYSLFLTKNKNVFGIGNNKEFQCGLNQQKIYKEITKIDGYFNIKKCIAHISISYFLNENGQLFASGKTRVFKKNCKQKRLINPNKNIKFIDIQVGYNYAIALTVDGLVYGWGTNIKLIRKNENQHPIQILVKDIRIKHIYCGSLNIFMIDYNNKLYIKGRNKFNICNQFDKKKKVNKFKAKTRFDDPFCLSDNKDDDYHLLDVSKIDDIFFVCGEFTKKTGGYLVFRIIK